MLAIYCNKGENQKLAVALECLLVQPGELVSPGDNRPDILVEVGAGVLLVLRLLLVYILQGVVKRRRRIDAPCKLRWCTEHGRPMWLGDPTDVTGQQSQKV